MNPDVPVVRDNHINCAVLQDTPVPLSSLKRNVFSFIHRIIKPRLKYIYLINKFSMVISKNILKFKEKAEKLASVKYWIF